MEALSSFFAHFCSDIINLIFIYHFSQFSEVPESPVMLPIPLSDVDSTSVLVKWKPRYDGMSPIRSYTLQYNKQPDGWKDYLSNVTGRVDIDANVTSLLVTRLLPSSSYSFRIKATNDVGDSAWSASSNMILTHPDGMRRF